MYFFLVLSKPDVYEADKHRPQTLETLKETILKKVATNHPPAVTPRVQDSIKSSST